MKFHLALETVGQNTENKHLYETYASLLNASGLTDQQLEKAIHNDTNALKAESVISLVTMKAIKAPAKVLTGYVGMGALTKTWQAVQHGYEWLTSSPDAADFAQTAAAKATKVVQHISSKPIAEVAMINADRQSVNDLLETSPSSLPQNPLNNEQVALVQPDPQADQLSAVNATNRLKDTLAALTQTDQQIETLEFTIPEGSCLTEQLVKLGLLDSDFSKANSGAQLLKLLAGSSKLTQEQLSELQQAIDQQPNISVGELYQQHPDAFSGLDQCQAGETVIANLPPNLEKVRLPNGQWAFRHVPTPINETTSTPDVQITESTGFVETQETIPQTTSSIGELTESNTAESNVPTEINSSQPQLEIVRLPNGQLSFQRIEPESVDVFTAPVHQMPDPQLVVRLPTPVSPSHLSAVPEPEVLLSPQPMISTTPEPGPIVVEVPKPTSTVEFNPSKPEMVAGMQFGSDVAELKAPDQLGYPYSAMPLNRFEVYNGNNLDTILNPPDGVIGVVGGAELTGSPGERLALYTCAELGEKRTLIELVSEATTDPLTQLDNDPTMLVSHADGIYFPTKANPTEWRYQLFEKFRRVAAEVVNKNYGQWVDLGYSFRVYITSQDGKVLIYKARRVVVVEDISNFGLKEAIKKLSE